MNSRYLIPVLCLGAVVFACGPRTRNEAASTTRNNVVALSAEIPASRAPRLPDEPRTIEAHVYVNSSASSVRVAMQVVNSGRKRVELTFPTGQRYDFVILDSIGRVVWNWSAGRMFTQALQNKILNAGETLDVEETWTSARLAPGRYVARGVLKSENYPLVGEAEFTIDGATLAQRE